MPESNDVWNSIITDLSNCNCGRDDHPKVVAVITDLDNNEFVKGKHQKSNSALKSCIHAEEDAIKRAQLNIHGHDKLKFFSSLEPCNQRKRYKIPCAHRIGTQEFREVHIGMLDPDPNIFGRGGVYLIENLGKEKIHYAPRNIRQLIYKEDKNYTRQFDRKSYRERFFISFKENFPIFSGYEEEKYLETAYALGRMYTGKKVVWFFPELPTFSDRHKFQAWWAQGILENASIEKIELIVHKKQWMEAIKPAKNHEMEQTLLNEFKGKSRKLSLFISDQCNNNCPCRTFRGGIFLNQNLEDFCRTDIDCLMIPYYSDLLGESFSVFLVTDLKYLAYTIKKPNRTADAVFKEIKRTYISFINSIPPENKYNIYTRLQQDFKYL